MACVLYYSWFVLHKTVHFEAVEDAGLLKIFRLSLSAQQTSLNTIGSPKLFNGQQPPTKLHLWCYFVDQTTNNCTINICPCTCGKRGFHMRHFEYGLTNILIYKMELESMFGEAGGETEVPETEAPSFRRVPQGTIKEKGGKEYPARWAGNLQLLLLLPLIFLLRTQSTVSPDDPNSGIKVGMAQALRGWSFRFSCFASYSVRLRVTSTSIERY